MTFNQGDKINIQIKSEAFTYKDDFEKHLNDKNNPHTIEFEEAKDLEELVSEENMSLSFGKIAKAVRSLISHLADKISHITKEEREQWNKATATSVSMSLTSGTKVGTITIDEKDYDLYAPTNTDTKNTAGATDSSAKLFLVGATSQSANPQTYSQDTAYVGTDGCLYSNNKKTVTTGEISSSVAITTQGQYALDAREKNASIEGTLANQIGTLNSNLNTKVSTSTLNSIYLSISKNSNTFEFDLSNIKLNNWRSFLVHASNGGMGSDYNSPIYEINTFHKDGIYHCQAPIKIVDGNFNPLNSATLTQDKKLTLTFSQTVYGTVSLLSF